MTREQAKQTMIGDYKRTYVAHTFGLSQVEHIIVQRILKAGLAKVRFSEKTSAEFYKNLFRIAQKHNLKAVFDTSGICRLSPA